MADLTARLGIELRRRNGRVEARIRSSRPTLASRVFIGKSVEETAAGLPALFSICAVAQACACASACEAALGLVAAPAVIRLRRLLVDAETVKEHLWRLLLDWPRFLDEPPREEAMSKAMGVYFRLRTLLTRPADPLRPGADVMRPPVSAAIQALDGLALLCEKQVLGAYPADWLAGIQSPEDFLGWAASTRTAPARLIDRVQARGWASTGSNPVTALPPLGARDLEPLLSGAHADRFAAEPLWRGAPRESTSFTRRRDSVAVAALTAEQGNGLLPRLAAQLVELASLQRDLRSGLQHLSAPVDPLGEGSGEGVGIAQVTAARGLLVHRAAVDRGRISDYRILAPTEWNFHPCGVVARGLSALPVTDAATLERQAGLFVTAADPCVEYHLTLS